MKLIRREDLQQLNNSAVEAPRRRAHRNIHDHHDANVQRLLMSLQPNTYVRPHCHPQAHKWELFLLVEGAVSFLVFSPDGQLLERVELSENGNRLLELPPNTFHTLVCQQPNTIVFEVKEGAYIPSDEKDFAAWAPKEGDERVAALLERFRHAQVGDSFA